jgi:hypothetical protein
MWGTLETSMFEVKSLLRLRSTLTSSTKFAKSEILKFSRIRPSRAVSQLVNPNYFGASSKIIRLNQLAEVKKVVLVPPFL